MPVESPISQEQSTRTTPPGVEPSSEVKLVNDDQTGKLAISGHRDSQQELNYGLEPDISGKGTSSEESRDLHMEEHSEGGADWEGENEQNIPH